MRQFSTLTHLDQNGKVKMVNVIDKKETARRAVARGQVKVGPKISELISQNSIKKGNVLTIAQIAGIMAAKNTSNLIPLTHNISLSSVKVDLSLDGEFVNIESVVECFGKTGVEIEALTAVSLAALTIYDMCKAVSHDIEINNVRLIEKTGGKSDFIKT
jgi:molybdenum cofactor biosynthesis protein MoaC